MDLAERMKAAVGRSVPDDFEYRAATLDEAKDTLATCRQAIETLQGTRDASVEEFERRKGSWLRRPSPSDEEYFFEVLSLVDDLLLELRTAEQQAEGHIDWFEGPS